MKNRWFPFSDTHAFRLDAIGKRLHLLSGDLGADCDKQIALVFVELQLCRYLLEHRLVLL